MAAIQPTTTFDDLMFDDTLREILVHLDNFDLFAVAAVNTSFKRNAQAVISSRYQQERFKIFIRCDTMWDAQKGAILQKMRLPSVLRYFGKFVNSVDICVGRRDVFPALLGLIDQYCVDSLDELSMHRIYFTAHDVSKLQPILKRLTTLNLHNCVWRSMPVGEQMSLACSELQTLRVTYNPDCYYFASSAFVTGVAFPKLKCFSIENCGGTTIKSIQKMLEVNPQLNELNIVLCNQVSDEILPSIVRNVPQIEKISFRSIYPTKNFIKNAKNLKELTELKSLDMFCCYKRILPVIGELAAAHVPLECLKLEQFVLNQEVFNGISKLGKLKELHLIDIDDDGGQGMECSDGMLKMIRNLSELTHLRLHVAAFVGDELVEIIRCAPKLHKLILELQVSEQSLHEVCEAVIDGEVYNDILDVLATREGMCCLEITFIPAWQQFLNVPITVLKANEDKLKIIFKEK